jgi:type VI secretion system protein ImpF
MGSRDDFDVRVTPSLLDRLLDGDPRSSRDAILSRQDSVRELKRAVQRDLENLLNSRNSYPDLPPAFVEAGQSALTYGLPDFSGLNPSNPADQNRLRHHIESVVRAFEPRLSGISATFVPSATTERSMRLRLDARLLIDPTPEPVSFDVVVPVQSMACEVREAS